MTTTKLVTAEQFMAIDEDGRFDLIDGEVYNLGPAKSWHGVVSGNIVGILGLYARDHGGETPTAEASYLLARRPDSVLCPETAYVSPAQMATLPRDWDSWFPFSPEIAIEVLSGEELPHITARKVELYLNAGSNQVWVVDTIAETLTVHGANVAPTLLTATMTLDGIESLPGFRLDVAELFR